MFDELCPTYIAYGMTYEQFWYGDPWMTVSYAKAYLLKKRVLNEELWLQGIYMTHALTSVIGSAFGKKKINYITKPLDVFPKTEAEKKREILAERQRLIDSLNRWKQSVVNKTGVDKHGKP